MTASTPVPAASNSPTTEVSRDERRILRRILIAGILLRILVYAFLEPHNNDPHWEIVEFIVHRGRLPISNELLLSFHPPLYYLLAAPLAVVGSAKFVQSLSLLLSVGNLYLIYRLLKTTCLLSRFRTRRHALILAAFLPQYVLFGLFVSNDSLSFAIGTLCYIQAFRYIDRPTRGTLALLGAALGAGLLTKGTFLAFGPTLVLVVVAATIRRNASVRRLCGALALFFLCAAGIGSYKFVENTIHLGRPIPTANDSLSKWTDVVARQQKASIPELAPVMIYVTLWYSYIKESNFTATREAPLYVIPGAIYLLGLPPTLLMFVGAWRMARHIRPMLNPLRRAAPLSKRQQQELMVLSAIFFHLLLVFAWGFLHGGAWSIFQARLLFPAFFSITILFGGGLDALFSARPNLTRFWNVWLFVLYAVFACYYLAEITCQLFRQSDVAGVP